MARLRKPNGSLTQVLSCRVWPEQAEAFERLAQSMGLTVSSLLAELVIKAVERHEPDLIAMAHQAAWAEAEGWIAPRIRKFAPFLRELKDYQAELERCLNNLKAQAQDVAAYVDDIKPVVERYAPEVLKDEVSV